MKNPKWYQQDKTHKGIKFGPGGLMVPLCKLTHRSEWPSDGCWSIRDISSYVWRKVDCTYCGHHRPKPR